MYRVLWGAAVLRTSLAAELEFYINLQCPVGRGTPDLMLFCISNIHLLCREIKHLLKLQETIEPANVIITHTHTHTHLAHIIQFLKHSWWPRRVWNLINSRAFKLYFFLWLYSFGQNSFNQDHPHEIKNSTCLCSSSVFCSLSLSSPHGFLYYFQAPCTTISFGPSCLSEIIHQSISQTDRSVVALWNQFISN